MNDTQHSFEPGPSVVTLIPHGSRDSFDIARDVRVTHTD